jgi:hypothetical protein
MDFANFVFSPIWDNLGAAVATKIAIRPTVTANSINELPLFDFRW